MHSLLEFNGEASGGVVVVVGDRHVSLSCVVVECSCLTMSFRPINPMCYNCLIILSYRNYLSRTMSLSVWRST